MARQFDDMLDDFEQIFSHPGILGFSPFVRELREVVAKKPSGYPPRNIIRTGDDTWMLECALAGFAPHEVEVEEHDGYVKVRGHSTLAENAGMEYVHQGMARRDFELSIKLGEHVKVDREHPPIMQNGVLVVQFFRLIPEAQKSTKWTPVDGNAPVGADPAEKPIEEMTDEEVREGIKADLDPETGLPKPGSRFFEHP